MHARVRSITPEHALFGSLTAHGAHTLATFVSLPSGNWRVQVRRKGRYVSETFRRRKDAEEWALDNERRIDRGEAPRRAGYTDPNTFGHLVDLHLSDMQEVGTCPRRSKAFSLEALQKKLGKVRIAYLNRERLVTFGKDRAREGAGPVTMGADFGYIKMIIAHAAAVHGISVSIEPVDLAPPCWAGDCLGARRIDLCDGRRTCEAKVPYSF